MAEALNDAYSTAFIRRSFHKKLSLQVQCPGQSDLQLPIFKSFFVDAINRKLFI